MKLDDLKAAWKQEIDQSVRVEGSPMRTIMSDVKKIDREVRFRDFLMIFALAMGALLYLIFGWLTQENVDLLSRLGVLVFVAATTVMSVALIRARSVTRSDDWTLCSRIEMEMEKLEKQRRLMNRVGYWFVLPMLITNGYRCSVATTRGPERWFRMRREWLFLPPAAWYTALRTGSFAGKRRENGTPSWLGCSGSTPIC